jgi:hypothetical protein
MDPMTHRTGDSKADPRRALTEQAAKSGDIKSGVATARAVKSRAAKRSHDAHPPTNSIVTRSSAYIEPETRDAMVAEAAYFRSAHRGFEPGHEVDDWLAAESDIDAALTRGDLPQFCG